MAIMLPPQPSARAVRMACSRMCCRVLVVADVGAVQGFDHFAVDAAWDDASVLPQLLAFRGGALNRGQSSRAAGQTGRCNRSARSLAISFGARFSMGMPYLAATMRSLATSRIR